MYSHDRLNAQVNNVCRYYLQGKCNFGERCRYDHVRPKPQTSIQPQPVSLPSYPPLPQTFVQPKPPPINGAVPMSYASVCRGTNDMTDPSIMIDQISLTSPTFLFQSLCPYAEKDGICEALETGRYCPYVHGEICDLCGMPALHPINEKQREEHRMVNQWFFSSCRKKY